MVRVLTITAIVAILSGCASCPVPVTIDKPARPDLIPMSSDLWQQIPLEAQDTITHNDLALKRYAKQLEARIDAVQESAN